MPKTYTAQSVGKNHDWDFSVDEQGNIKSLAIKSIVQYNPDFTRMEVLDVWPLLIQEKKDKAQTIYNFINQIFNAEFLG